MRRCTTRKPDEPPVRIELESAVLAPNIKSDIPARERRAWSPLTVVQLPAMRVAIVLSLAAIIAGLASGRSTTNYDDFVAKGYRWVTVDGPYACVSRDDLRQISKNHTAETDLQLIRQQRAYYLLQGDIVKVVREDVTSGLALIRMAGIPKELWTQTKFLSKRPVENAFGVVETPETSGLILSGVTSIVNSPEPPGATPVPSTSPQSTKGSHAKPPETSRQGLPATLRAPVCAKRCGQVFA